MRLKFYQIIIFLGCGFGLLHAYDTELQVANEYYKNITRTAKKKKAISKSDAELSLGQKIYDSTLAKFAPKKSKINEDYYDKVLATSLDRRSKLKLTVAQFFTGRGFKDSNGISTQSLADTIFYRPFAFRDIMLATKLSEDGQVFKSGEGIDSQVVTLDDLGDNYLALIASTKVKIDADLQETFIRLTGSHQFKMAWLKKAEWAVGIDAPFKYVHHRMSPRFLDSNLLGNWVSEPDYQNSMQSFFYFYNSLEDFFYKAILRPKGLSFSEDNSKFGIGDVSLFTYADFANYFKRFKKLRGGLELVLPTGGKEQGDTVWEIVLGNGGAFQLGAFIDAFYSIDSFLNLRFFSELTYSFPYHGKKRITQIKNNSKNLEVVQYTATKNVEASFVPNTPTYFPENFRNYYVLEFSGSDSEIPYFADAALKTKVERGLEFRMRLGNYWFDLMNTSLTLAIFYDLFMKAKDDFKDIQCATFTACPNYLRSRSGQIANTFNWFVGYQPKKDLEVRFGSSHVFMGKNVPVRHGLFGSLIVVF